MLSDGIPKRGPFTFPLPWNTRACRVTNADDGVVRPIGYTYWSNMNNSAGRPWAWIFLSLNDRYTLFRLDKATLEVKPVKELPFIGWGEGSYFSFTEPDRLYVPRGQQLLAYDVQTEQTDVVFDAPAPMRQCHSSADGRVHSLTLDGLPAVHRRGEFQVFPVRAEFDECQIDKSGRWLLVKEGHDNRIFDLDTDTKHLLTDAELAVGHSDMGYGYVVGEEDQSPPGGVFRLWQFPLVNRGRVYTTGSWDRATRYVSHCNAQPWDPASQVALFSSMHDDIVLAPLDGSMRRIPIAPSLCSHSDEYWQQPRATLDPTGAFAIWTANMGSDRLDAFVVQIAAASTDPVPIYGSPTMSVPNRKAVIEQVLERFHAQIVQMGPLVDGVGRRLLPHFIEAMPENERPNWGVLRKSTGTFPYDILVWRPTREHVDVLTSKPLTQDENGLRRLVGTWGVVGILPRKEWTWCDWRDSTIVPLEDAAVVDDPPVIVPPPTPPDPPVPGDPDLTARVASIESWARSFPK